MANADTPQTVYDLVSEEVGGIHFVRDYVEIYFDGPVLRSLSPPTIITAGISLTFPALGSRDSLCELIGQRLVDLKIVEELLCTLLFENGATLLIPFSDPNSISSEYMHFMSGLHEGIQVW